MTHAASHTEQELRIERYPALEREVTDPPALGLMPREAEARASPFSVTTSPEPLGDEIALIPGDAQPIVEDADGAVVLDHELDSRFRSRMVDRVLSEIEDRATQHFRTALHPDRCRCAQ